MLRQRCVQLVLAAVIVCSLATGAWSADTYVIDPSHTTVGFTVQHLVINKVRGKFNDFNATLVYDPNAKTFTSMQGTIQAASIDTDHEKRDNHLRSEDFFEVETYPEITFESTGVEKQGDGYVMHGMLTIHGVTKEVAIPFNITGQITHRGQTRVGFEASLDINRKDYAIKYNSLTDTGGLVVGDEVTIELVGEAIKQS